MSNQDKDWKPGCGFIFICLVVSVYLIGEGSPQVVTITIFILVVLIGWWYVVTSNEHEDEKRNRK